MNEDLLKIIMILTPTLSAGLTMDIHILFIIPTILTSVSLGVMGTQRGWWVNLSCIKKQREEDKK